MTRCALQHMSLPAEERRAEHISHAHSNDPAADHSEAQLYQKCKISRAGFHFGQFHIHLVQLSFQSVQHVSVGVIVLCSAAACAQVGPSL